MIFQTVFMYLVICSTSLIYGVGIKNLVDVSKKLEHAFVLYLKSLLCVLISVPLTWLITNLLLLPYNLYMLFPFFVVLISVFFSILLQQIFYTVLKVNTAEFSVTFFSVLLAISDGTTLLHSFIIGVVAVSSFYVLAVLLFTIRKKNRFVKVAADFNTGSLILVAMACIILALYGWNISWLTMEVFG